MDRNERRNYLRSVKWRAVRIYKATVGCMDCGMTDSRCLQLDHVRGTKFANVSDMVRSDRAWTAILAEVQKCEIVCANCHSIRTHDRRYA